MRQHRQSIRQYNNEGMVASQPITRPDTTGDELSVSSNPEAQLSARPNERLGPGQTRCSARQLAAGQDRSGATTASHRLQPPGPCA